MSRACDRRRSLRWPGSRRNEARLVMRSLLAVTAASEGVTGLAVAIAPLLVVRLLFGAEPSGAGLAMSRVAGLALLGPGLACCPPGDTGPRSPARVPRDHGNRPRPVRGPLADAGLVRNAPPRRAEDPRRRPQRHAADGAGAHGLARGASDDRCGARRHRREARRVR